MNHPQKNWWYSTDGKRGFNLGEVKGFDYKNLQQGSGVLGSTLYIYLGAGILHLLGAEADTVYGLIKGKGKE